MLSMLCYVAGSCLALGVYGMMEHEAPISEIDRRPNRLTQDQISEIRRLHSEGVSAYTLAKSYHVTHTTIYHHVRGHDQHRSKGKRLTDHQRQSITFLYRFGASKSAIADRMNISLVPIHRILRDVTQRIQVEPYSVPYVCRVCGADLAFVFLTRLPADEIKITYATCPTCNTLWRAVDCVTMWDVRQAIRANEPQPDPEPKAPKVHMSPDEMIDIVMENIKQNETARLYAGVKHQKPKQDKRGRPSRAVTLQNRQRVIELHQAGLTRSEIARQLRLTWQTVNKHILKHAVNTLPCDA